MTSTTSGLRPFQIRVRDLILQGKNVILQAPTGSGKTLAALSPFTTNLEGGTNALPLSCLYATPLRVLSTQFYDDYKAFIAYMDQKEGTDYGRRYERLGRRPISIQTGEQSDDPQFESLLTFCTIDQLLASFLSIPYGIGKRRANLNVGAVIGSYLVLDEFHLYPLKDEEHCYGARTTTLVMLSLLQGITSFILMTATFSRPLLEQLKVLLNAEIVTIEDEQELQKIARGRRCFFEVADTAMSAEAILARHQDCSLVICNTVLRAQQRYWELRQCIEQGGADSEVVLLHSRLTAKDRTERSKFVMEQLGPAPREWKDGRRYGWQNGQYHGRNIIVVATQVVEVGLDISVQTLHTEAVPANSLIQRAGRCARFAQQEGHVIVYELPTDPSGKQASTLPYHGELCRATVQELKRLDLSVPIDFKAEQALINAVHTAEDTELLQRFEKRKESIVKDIFTSLNEHSSSVVANLIRDVAQVQVLIHDDPQHTIREKPWEWQSFSLHPGSLAAHWKSFEEMKDTLEDVEWVCRQAIASQLDQEDAEADSRQITVFDWPVLPYLSDPRARERTLRGTVMLALPSQLATYHPTLGFMLRDDWPELPWPEYQSTLMDEGKKKKPDYASITQQSYQVHISGLVAAYNNGIAQHLGYVAHKLETRLGLPANSIDHALRLALACHDFGKLSVQWQQWAFEWQTLLYEHEGWGSYAHHPHFFFAKTDYDARNPEQRKLQHATKTKKPHHACESVVSGLPLIVNSLGLTFTDHAELALLRAVCGAIARHHTPSADDYNPFQLHPGSISAIQEALELARQGLAWTYDLKLISTDPQSKGKLMPENGQQVITRPERGRMQELETWLYFVIVRALRLADQRADDFRERR